MSRQQPFFDEIFSRSVVIQARAEHVWQVLTEPELMKQWMAQTEMEVLTDWQVGSSFIIQGPWYKTQFKNTGTVLHFEPYRRLGYTHLSSLSRLPDEPQNYTSLVFNLSEDNDHTRLTLTVTNFPTEAIYRHFVFYWGVTLELLKKFVETGSITSD